MSIKRITAQVPDSSDSVVLNFDNGDYKVLNMIKEQWKFKDEESLLRFALAVLLKAENHAVSVKDETGNETTLKPTEDLLTKE